VSTLTRTHSRSIAFSLVLLVAAASAAPAQGAPDLDLPQLVEALGAETARERVDAAVALGALGPSAEDAVPALIEAVADESRFVRVEVVRALGAVGGAAAPAVPRLVAALEDEDRSVRMAALGALGDIGVLDPSHVEAMGAKLSDPELHVRRSAVFALSALGPKAAPAQAALIQALEVEDPKLRDYALRVLGEISLEVAGEDLPEGHPLCGAVEDPALSLRAIQVIERNALGGAAVDALVKVVTDSKARYRPSALKALSRLGTRARPAVGAIAAMFAEGGGDLRLRLNLLGFLVVQDGAAPLPESAVNAVLGALSDEDTVIRSEAFRRVAKLGPRAKPARLVLEEALRSDPDDDLRREAATALGAIGGVQVVPALVEALGDPQARVYGAATDALVRVGVPALPRLVEERAGGSPLGDDALRRIGEAARAQGTPQTWALSAVYGRQAVGLGLALLLWFVMLVVYPRARAPSRVGRALRVVAGATPPTLAVGVAAWWLSGVDWVGSYLPTSPVTVLPFSVAATLSFALLGSLLAFGLEARKPAAEAAETPTSEDA
jgi:HEAT repeat protein